MLGSLAMKTSRKLGILVSSNRHLDKIIKLCEAAEAKDVEVIMFFTHLGTLLTQEPRFSELEGKARMSLCSVAFEGHGLNPPVKGIDAKGFGTQAENAEMIENCDRYVVF
jgi:hypothetical protein